MPTFSRWMPAAPERPETVLSRLAVALLAIGVLAAAARWPVPVVGGALALVGLGQLVARRDRRRLLALAAARRGEDIGTFARAFDRRAPGFDPWVVRAVWDAVQAHLVSGGRSVPVRPADDLATDLRIDPDDVAFNMLDEIAARTGRDVRAAPRRPPARVDTVGDLVAFVSALPRRAPA